MKMNRRVTLASGIGPLLISLVAFASTAVADVVYTPANVTLSGNGSIKIDLNHDAITDFVLRSALTAAYCGTVGGGYTGTTKIVPAMGDGVVVSHLNFAALLASGISVDASSTFYNAGTIVARLTACNSSSKSASGYLGLEFLISGQIHYGWAQVAISVHSGFRPGMRTTLIDFAYETVPGRAITTGQIPGNLSETEPPPASINPIDLSISSQLAAQAAQESSEKIRHDRHHISYRLVDLGTFGGPNSAETEEFPFINNAGMVVGFADTSIPDPNPEGFVFHPFRWSGGPLIDLGSLPGGANSFAIWSNNRGEAVGLSENGIIDPLLGAPEGRATLWKKHSGIVDLGTLGGNEGLAAAINERSQIVGAAANDIPDPFSIFGWGTQTRAFLWQKGTMLDLGTLGGPDAFAIFINERGQVAGVAYTNSTPNSVTGTPTQDPFLWENGKMKDLGTLGGTQGFVNAFNNRGEVAGESNLAGDLTSRPFLWDGRVLKDLGTFGGSVGFATALNDIGEVAGGARTADDETLHAFLWRNGVMTDLGTIKDDTCSVAHSMNSKGLVVGTSGDCDDVFEMHGFLSEQGGPLIDLNDFVPPGSNLVITDGETINDAGEIAGSGMLPNGDFHAIALIPCTEGSANQEGCLAAGENTTALVQSEARRFESHRKYQAPGSESVRTAFERHHGRSHKWPSK